MVCVLQGVSNLMVGLGFAMGFKNLMVNFCFAVGFEFDGWFGFCGGFQI